MGNSGAVLTFCGGCHERFQGEWDITYVDDLGYTGTLSFSCQTNAIAVSGTIRYQGTLVGNYQFSEVVCPPLPFPPQGIDMQMQYRVFNLIRNPVGSGRMVLHLFLDTGNRINGRYFDEGGGEGMMLIFRRRQLHGLTVSGVQGEAKAAGESAPMAVPSTAPDPARM